MQGVGKLIFVSYIIKGKSGRTKYYLFDVGTINVGIIINVVIMLDRH